MKNWIIQLLIAVGLAFLAVLLVFQVLKMYTHHKEAITVPDFKEMTVDQVKSLTSQKKLKIEVIGDAYVADLPPGVVLDQNPKANSKVKQKRTIYLTLNSETPPPVKMPDLVDNSLRQAELKLRNLGLSLGKVTYRPDIYKDVVLQQLHKGKRIEENATVLKGEAIDLIVGDGLGNRTLSVPDLVGLRYQEALLALQASSLNVGNIIFNGNESDKSSAIVYEQSPGVGSADPIQMGEGIDLYLTVLSETEI